MAKILSFGHCKQDANQKMLALDAGSVVFSGTLSQVHLVSINSSYCSQYIEKMTLSQRLWSGNFFMTDLEGLFSSE